VCSSDLENISTKLLGGYKISMLAKDYDVSAGCMHRVIMGYMPKDNMLRSNLGLSPITRQWKRKRKPRVKSDHKTPMSLLREIHGFIIDQDFTVIPHSELSSFEKKLCMIILEIEKVLKRQKRKA